MRNGRENIGERIKEFRKRNNLSVPQLARVLALPKDRIYKWEKGTVPYDTADYEKIEKILKYGLESMENMETRVNESPHLLIPLYDDVITYGGTKDSNGGNTATVATGYIAAGGWFKGATAALRHYGSSMAEYPSGCILALKEQTDKTDFIWGQNYVIEYGDDHNRITKKVQKGEDESHITACSTNEETYKSSHRLIHEPKSIEIKEIKRLFLVLGVVVKEHSATGVVEMV